MSELKAPPQISLKKGLEQASREIADSPNWLRALREQNKRLQLNYSSDLDSATSSSLTK